MAQGDSAVFPHVGNLHQHFCPLQGKDTRSLHWIAHAQIADILLVAEQSVAAGIECIQSIAHSIEKKQYLLAMKLLRPPR